MPRIIDYVSVLERMQAAGFVSLYHNAGAFGFAPGAAVQNFGWIEADDPSIRPAALVLARKVESLDALLLPALDAIGCEAWLMPKSHWHYELHFGNHELLEGALADIGINPAILRDRNDGSAIAFDAAERNLLCETTKRLLAGLRGSDFTMAFPDAQTVCTIHHHRQLWWQTLSSQVAELIGRAG